MKSRVNWDNHKDDYKTVFIDRELMDSEFSISKRNGVWTEKAGEMILTLTENVCFSNYFKVNSDNFIVTEAMIDDVVMYILENGLRLYNPELSAFSYFTKVVFTKAYGFLRIRYGKLKRVDLYGKKLKRRIKGGWQTVEVEHYDDNLFYKTIKH